MVEGKLCFIIKAGALRIVSVSGDTGQCGSALATRPKMFADANCSLPRSFKAEVFDMVPVDSTLVIVSINSVCLDSVLPKLLEPQCIDLAETAAPSA